MFDIFARKNNLKEQKNVVFFVSNWQMSQMNEI